MAAAHAPPSEGEVLVASRAAAKTRPAASEAPGAAASLTASLAAGAGSAPTETPAEIALADALHSAAIHLLRRLRVRDRASGIGPAQLSALSVLVFGGPQSLGALAAAEQVRPPTMSRIVAGLQRSGLLRRHATEDGRRMRLEATPKGVALLWESRQRRVETLASALGKMAAPERATLQQAAGLLQQLLRQL